MLLRFDANYPATIKALKDEIGEAIDQIELHVQSKMCYEIGLIVWATVMPAEEVISMK